MLQNLNFSQIYYFKLIVDHGSIAKASQVGNITPSAISMQIKSLESFLGKELFSRKKRKLTLTKDGNVVYEYANTLFKTSSEMLSIMKDEKSARHVRLNIGVHHDIPKNLVANITSYIFSQGEAHVSIQTKEQGQLNTDILNNDLDLAIVSRPPSINDKALIDGKCVVRSPIVFAGSKAFLRLKGKSISEFSKVPLILPNSRLELRRKLEVEFARHNAEMNVVAEVDDAIIKKNMAIAGNGVVPIMKSAINNYLKSRQLYILSECKGIQDEIWLITNKVRKPHQIVQGLLKDLQVADVISLR